MGAGRDIGNWPARPVVEKAEHDRATAELRADIAKLESERADMLLVLASFGVDGDRLAEMVSLANKMRRILGGAKVSD